MVDLPVLATVVMQPHNNSFLAFGHPVRGPWQFEVLGPPHRALVGGLDRKKTIGHWQNIPVVSVTKKRLHSSKCKNTITYSGKNGFCPSEHWIFFVFTVLKCHNTETSALVVKIPYLRCENLLHVWRRGPVLCFVDSQPLVWVGVDRGRDFCGVDGTTRHPSDCSKAAQQTRHLLQQKQTFFSFNFNKAKEKYL